MNRIPDTTDDHKIAPNHTQQEREFLLDLRRCRDKHLELVTHAERNLIAMIRAGRVEIAASTARELASIAADYAAYQARCDADEALGFRPAS